MGEFQAKAIGEEIELVLLDDSGQRIAARTDRYGAFAVLSTLGQAIQSLPADPAAPIVEQQPVLRSSQPSFVVGIAENGAAVLVIRPDPLPPLEFHFDGQALEKLIADLKKVAVIPADMRAAKTMQ